MNSKLALTILVICTLTISAYGQKSQKNENANLTPEQQMSRDNDRIHKKKKKDDNVKKKVKRAKKNDRASRRRKK